MLDFKLKKTPGVKYVNVDEGYSDEETGKK